MEYENIAMNDAGKLVFYKIEIQTWAQGISINSR